MRTDCTSTMPPCGFLPLFVYVIRTWFHIVHGMRVVACASRKIIIQITWNLQSINTCLRKSFVPRLWILNLLPLSLVLCIASRTQFQLPCHPLRWWWWYSSTKLATQQYSITQISLATQSVGYVWVLYASANILSRYY